MAFCYMIGIAGDFSSGKSMLADALELSYSHRKVITLRMDDYRKPESSLPLITLCDGTKYPDRYSPEVYDLPRMTQDISAIMTECRCRILIVEGAYTFFYKPIEQLCDIRVYVECPEELKETRCATSLQEISPVYCEHMRECYTRYIQPSAKEADLTVSSAESVEREVWQIRKTLKGLFL